MVSDTLSNRKQKILKAVIDEYIVTASPISSGELKRKYFDELSSATLRNELNTLEQMGYLIQPHTSAGRIPSNKAYNLYVDKFIEKTTLTKKEMSLIQTSFSERFTEVEDIVRQTAKVISDVTNYTSVIVLKNINKVLLKEIKLVDLDSKTILVIIITDSGIIRDKVITVDNEVDTEYIIEANILLNKIFSGKTVSDIKKTEQLVNEEMKEFRELYDNIIAILESYAHTNNNVFMEGKSKFLEHPDQDLDTTKDFLTVMDTQERLENIINENDDIEFSVKIGKGEDGQGIERCAVVTAKYKLNGKEIGHAGVIGPERMNYSKVVSVLGYIGKAVESILEGGKNDKKRIEGRKDDRE